MGFVCSGTLTPGLRLSLKEDDFGKTQQNIQTLNSVIQWQLTVCVQVYTNSARLCTCVHSASLCTGVPQTVQGTS